MVDALPIEEPDVMSIDELYSADTLDLTNDNLDALVDDLWKKREVWLVEDKEAKRTGRKPKKQYKPAPEKGQLTLKDLGKLQVSFRE